MLSDQTVAQIEALQTRYPQARGALLMALHAAQDEKGFLTKEDFAEIGDLFNLDPAEVESVSSFYTMYYTKPQGTCTFQLCTNVSCMVEGAYPVLRHLRETLGIAPGQVTEDGAFGLMEVECLAGCDVGPCMQVSDREFYPRVNTESIDRIIAHFRQGGTHPAPGAEMNPLLWTNSVAFEPIAPLAPGEMKQRTVPEAPKPAAASSAPAGPKPAPKTTVVVPMVATIVSGEPPVVALKAEAEAYERIEAAKRAIEREKAEAERMTRERMERFALQQAAMLAEAEEAERKRYEEVAAREKVKYEQAVKLTIVRPPEPEPEPEPEEDMPLADLSALEPGMHIGGAARPFSPPSEFPTTPALEPAPAPEPEPEPEPAPYVPPEPQLNLETAPDLPAWEPENPYLRFLQRTSDEPKKEAPDA